MLPVTRRLMLGMMGGTVVSGFASRIAFAQGGGDIEQIRWALPAIPETLFIPRAWTTYIGAIMANVQEGALGFGTDLAIQPAVAESYENVDDRTIRYTLRKGVKFHDGSDLTADDVVASMRFHMDPDSASQLAAFYNGVESIEADGDDAVVVKLAEPNAQFQYTPAHMAGFIFKKSQLEEEILDLGSPEVLPLGTGPYKVTEFLPATRVVLEAFDDYWGGRPAVRKIVIEAITDRQTRLLAIRNGDIDGTFDLSISDIDQWKALEGVDVVTAPSLGVYSITMDQSTAPFDDVHVRRAVAHCLDKEGLVSALLQGNGEPAVAINPPEMWSGVIEPEKAREFYATLDPYEFDIEKARAELEQSAHASGFSVTVSASNADPYMVNLLQTLSQNLAQIGINLTVQEVDHNQWLAQYFRHEDLGMQIMSYFPDFADPANYPQLFFHSSNAVADGLNGSNFKNEKVDMLLDKANAESDPQARAEALKEVLKIANEEVALVSVFWPDSAMAIRKEYKLGGYNAFWYNIPWAIRDFSKVG